MLTLCSPSLFRSLWVGVVASVLLQAQFSLAEKRLEAGEHLPMLNAFSLLLHMYFGSSVYPFPWILFARYLGRLFCYFVFVKSFTATPGELASP